MPPFQGGVGAGEIGAHEDEVCERIRADSRRLVSIGRHCGLGRYIDAIPGLEGCAAALDTAIVAVIETRVRSGASRDDAIESMLRERPELRDAVLAADFLDQTLGSGLATETEVRRGSLLSLPCEIGPAMAGGRRRYELRGRIAEGASGVVYRAIDRAVSTPDRSFPVAVKCLHDLGFRMPHLFKAEAQRARRVEHGSVARVLDAGEDPRAGEYLVFEYCEGHTFEQWASRRASRPSALEAVALVVSIAEGVSAVHRAGFCHGDLHPGNVIVTRDGSVRLIDFGAAHSDVLGVNASARPVGALGFAAPELFRAGASISGQCADGYSVAGLLFWLLTGEPPNGGTVEEAEATIGGERSLNAAAMRGQPRDLTVVLARALDTDALRRYPSVEAFSEDLRRWQRHEPLAWSPGEIRHRAGLAVRRAPVASALAAGIVAALAVVVASVALAVQVSNRSALAEARTQIAARESEISAQSARARAAEAIDQEMEVAKGLWSFVRAMTGSIRSDSDAMRYLPMLMVIEDIAGKGSSSDPMLQAESRQKRIQIAEARVLPALERGTIDHMEDFLVAMVLGGIRIEEGDAPGARRVLTMARGAARRLLAADDPLAVRADVYWAIATVLTARAGVGGVEAQEADEAALILAYRASVVESLGPRMLDRLQRANPEATP